MSLYKESTKNSDLLLTSTMSKLTFLAVLLTLLLHTALPQSEDYYWREYSGTIPKDAVVGGKDVKGNDIYIGQAYVRNRGLCPVTIHRGVREVVAIYYGKQFVDKYVKILCGPQQNFYWMTTNASEFHSMMDDRHAVVGGHEDDWGPINIGRVVIDGETRIGKINSFWDDDVTFYVYDGDDERPRTPYEVLLYDSFGEDVKNNGRNPDYSKEMKWNEELKNMIF